MSFLPIPDPKNKIIKVTAFAYKRPDVSLEAFLKHWRETHVEKFTRNPKVASKLLGYVQSHRDVEGCDKFTMWPLLDADGYAEFYVRTLDDWLEIANDPQHLNETIPDQDEFLDVPKMKILITDYEVRYWNLPWPGNMNSQPQQ